MSSQHQGVGLFDHIETHIKTNKMNNLFYLVPAAAVVALAFAYIFFRQMMKESEGTVTMKQIAQYVREGAMAYLKQQYKVVTIVFIILAALLRFLPSSAFRTAGFLSHSSQEVSSQVLLASWV